MSSDSQNGKVLVTCRKHWSAYIPVSLIAVMCLILFIGGISSGDIGVAVGIFVVAAALCGTWAISIHASYISLSQTTVLGRTGLIKTVKLAAPVSKVQNLSISNGLGGKIFGYHNVTIATAGTAGNEIVFKGITNAKMLQKIFIELADKVN